MTRSLTHRQKRTSRTDLCMKTSDPVALLYGHTCTRRDPSCRFESKEWSRSMTSGRVDQGRYPAELLCPVCGPTINKHLSVNFEVPAAAKAGWCVLPSIEVDLASLSLGIIRVFVQCRSQPVVPNGLDATNIVSLRESYCDQLVVRFPPTWTQLTLTNLALGLILRRSSFRYHRAVVAESHRMAV